MIEKTPIAAPILLDKLDGHNEVKDELIKLLSEDATTHTEDGINQISFVDYKHAREWERPWVKLAAPVLQKQFDKFGDHLGLSHPIIRELWYQRYKNFGDKHNWHVHSNNYTGVYYLKYADNGDMETQVVAPYDNGEKIILTVNEGDIVLFPSFAIHRSPPMKLDKEKIIISFNIDFEHVQQKIFWNLDHL